MANKSDISQPVENEVAASSLKTFHGNFTHNIDDKGRISLPAEFRRVLDLNKVRA